VIFSHTFQGFTVNSTSVSLTHRFIWQLCWYYW